MFLRRGLLNTPFCLLGEYILGTLCCVKGKSSIPRQRVVLLPEAGRGRAVPSGHCLAGSQGFESGSARLTV